MSVFRKASTLSYKHESFTLNGSDGVSAREPATECIFSKFRPLLLLAMTEFVADFVTESVFSLMLRRSLFLVKLQVFTVNSNE